MPISFVGLVPMIISGGTICSSLLSESLTKKLDTGIITAFSVFLTAAVFASLFFIGRHRDPLVGIVYIALPVAADILCLAGFMIMGLGLAPIYPSIIHSAPQNFGAKNAQAIIGIQMASAYIQSTFMPPLFGIIANAITLKLMPLYLTVFTLSIIIMIK